MKRIKFISILALLLTVTQGAWALDGSGTPEDPYLIKISQDWWDFANGVNNGTLSSSCAKMMANMGYTGTTIGTSEHPFTGTFDGNGFTVERGAGPGNPFFPYVSGATIKNLVVTGTFSFTETHKGALIGESTGNTTVENCRVSANITYGTTSVNGGTIVGFASAGSLTMRGCVFDGTITAPDGFYDFGGLMSKFNSSATAAIQNCVVNPSSVTGTPSRYNEHFSRGGSSISNSYYLCEPTAYISYPENYPEGGTGNVSTNLKGRSISAGTDVTALAISGAGTEYNVSGITAYSTGIKYGDVCYAGNGESVSLALSHADKAGYAFNQYAVAGGGTLTAQTETSATLSMTDANQTINATWTPTYTATFADGSGDTGWTITPASGVEGTTVTVSYSGENKVKSVTVQAKP